jgi:hypothetical protein
MDFKYNRYNDLIESIPKGSFYEGAGIVVPYRGKSTTTMRLETSSPNTTYVLYVNEIVAGEVTSDSNGNIVFSKVLPLGEVEIALLNKTSGRYQYTYLTTRDYAIWLAGYAEALETIDGNIQTLRNNMAIATADADALREVYGTPVETYNNLGMSNDAYRWMLQELRLGYRNFGGYYKGLETAISAFTQVPPFSYARRMWGPNWFLNHTLLLNNNFLNRSHSLEYTTASITGVTLVKAEPDCKPSTAFPHLLDYDVSSNTLQWRPDSCLPTLTPAIAVTDGELFLPGYPPRVPAHILGLAGTYAITTGTNDKLYLNIDNIGTLVVTLTGSPVLSTAQAVIDINDALIADTRYPGAYDSSASTYASSGGILITSPIITGGSVLLEPGPDNAALDLFGNKPGRLIFTQEPLVYFGTGLPEGISVVSLDGSAYTLGTGAITFQYDYSTSPSLRRFRWQSNGVAVGPWVNFVETGRYELVDFVGNICTVHIVEEDLFVAVGAGSHSYSFTYDYQAYNAQVMEIGGLWVNVNSTLLPAIDTSVEVTLTDDTVESPPEVLETPDYWEVNTAGVGDYHLFTPSVVSDGRDNQFDPCQSFAYRYVGTNRSVDFVSRVRQYPLSEFLPRGSASPNLGGPGGVYDYEGYDLVFSGYVKNLSGDAMNATLSVSFDGGDSWVSGVATAVTIDDYGFIDPTYLSLETQIPANISISTTNYKDSGVLVRVTAALVATNSMDVSLEGFTAEVKYISSRSLGNATMARSRHRQYFGELVYIWSPEALNITEKRYLGLPHAIADRNVPISGVEITSIDVDTPPGSGVFEYEYNKTVPTFRLRWTPNGTSWAPGFGWTSVTNNGSVILTAPDSTTMTVLVTFSLLPILIGTAPVVKSTNLTISSTRSHQGHSRKVSPAHSSVDIFDVTEYDSNGDPLNLKGVISEADFSLCTLLNMDIYSTTPFRYSYCYPTVTNVSGESVTFVFAGGSNYDADLDYNSDMDVLTTIIYEDGLPVPNDKWTYVDSNTVRITSGFNSGATYTIDYKPICQVTTPVIDMGALRANWAWWADYLLWERFESEKGEFEATVPVFFNMSTGRAYLDRRSNRDLNSSRLYVISGNRQEERTIPKRYWNYVDDFTISIDVSQIQAGQFYLTHTEKRVYEESFLTVTFEQRSGSNPTNCLAATWETLQKNENITVTNQYHQMRMTVSGMIDDRDFRLRSMVLKGLRLHGATPSVPAMTSIWGV